MAKHKGSEWAPLYMLIVVVIAAIVLLTLIKPTLKGASESAIATTGEARAIAGIGGFLFYKLKNR